MTVPFPPVSSKANRCRQYLCKGWSISASCLQPWPAVNADEGMPHHKTHSDPSLEHSPKPQMCGWGTSQCNQNKFIFSIIFSSYLWSFTTSCGEELFRLNWLWVKNYFSFSIWSELPPASYSGRFPVPVLEEKVDNYSWFTFLCSFYLYHLPPQ